MNNRGYNHSNTKTRTYSIVNDWKAAIGLQTVDGLQPSDYLYELAGKHIQGEMDIQDVRRSLKVYYESKSSRGEDESRTAEADKVAANIMEVLQDGHFSLSSDEYRSIHESLFQDVFSHAGVFRLTDISKREWVLQYDTVNYCAFHNIIPSLDRVMEAEKSFNYNGLSDNEKLEHFADFIAGVWKIHPFYEGNTRTTALFAIKYLRKLGYSVDNEVIRQYSWFFRNALARACYSNPAWKVECDSTHLYKFFKNLLAGENNSLRNRDILILPPSGWSEQVSGENKTPEAISNSKLDLGNRISHVDIYKHNETVSSIKCHIDGVEVGGKHIKLRVCFIRSL